MLQNIVSRLKKNDVAVLISDMKYSPVGSAAPEVLLTQYAADVARIAGNSKKAYSLICAISDYINKEGNDVIPFLGDTVFGKSAAKKQLPDFSTGTME
jgi:hypothetical protein